MLKQMPGTVKNLFSSTALDVDVLYTRPVFTMSVETYHVP